MSQKLQDLTEKMGDRPAWMKIKSYREEGRRAELVLGLGKKKKNYWFPISPAIYEKFRGKISSSRYEGLTYLQDYIRRYRGYLGRWPSRRYVERNKIAKSLLTESVGQTVLRMFSEGMSIDIVARETDLSVDLVSKFLKVTGNLAGNLSL